MLETVRSAILSTFILILVSLIGGFVYARVPMEFIRCEEEYKIQSKIPPTVNLQFESRKESECIKSREDLNDFESCLATSALNNNFPISALLLAGHISEIRDQLGVICASVAY